MTSLPTEPGEAAAAMCKVAVVWGTGQAQGAGRCHIPSRQQHDGLTLLPAQPHGALPPSL